MRIAKKYQFIDLSYLDLMADGDLEMKKLMIGMLFSEPVNDIAKLKQFAQHQDLEQIANTCHKLKSTFAFVGNAELNYINKQIEKLAAERKNANALPELVQQLANLFEEVLKELRVVYASL